MKAFSLALESMGKPAFSIGRIAPTLASSINSSTTRLVPVTTARSTRVGPGTTAPSGCSPNLPHYRAEDRAWTLLPSAESPEGLDELLMDELRDILHAEKQLTKALPQMAEAARFDQLRELFELHLEETEAQIERLNECFQLLGKTARAKPCKGMMGLVEEGREVIEEGENKEAAAADLALIGAAQRVEHYEISGYTTARNLAQQLRQSAVVALLSKSLAEEENADQLLNQVARSLMSVARMPAAIELTTAPDTK
jgi:Mn-containing catalase